MIEESFISQKKSKSKSENDFPSSQQQQFPQSPLQTQSIPQIQQSPLPEKSNQLPRQQSPRHSDNGNIGIGTPLEQKIYTLEEFERAKKEETGKLLQEMEILLSQLDETERTSAAELAERRSLQELMEAAHKEETESLRSLLRKRDAEILSLQQHISRLDADLQREKSLAAQQQQALRKKVEEEVVESEEKKWKKHQKEIEDAAAAAIEIERRQKMDLQIAVQQLEAQRSVSLEKISSLENELNSKVGLFAYPHLLHLFN